MGVVEESLFSRPLHVHCLFLVNLPVCVLHFHFISTVLFVHCFLNLRVFHLHFCEAVGKFIHLKRVLVTIFSLVHLLVFLFLLAFHSSVQSVFSEHFFPRSIQTSIKILQHLLKGMLCRHPDT